MKLHYGRWGITTRMSHARRPTTAPAYYGTYYEKSTQMGYSNFTQVFSYEKEATTYRLQGAILHFRLLLKWKILGGLNLMLLHIRLPKSYLALNLVEKRQQYPLNRCVGDDELLLEWTVWAAM